MTLVAILGGFLLTKFYSIASEISGMDRLVSDLRAALEIEQEQLREAEWDFETFSLAWDMGTRSIRSLFIEMARAEPPGSEVTDAMLASELESYGEHRQDVLDAVRDHWNAEACRVVAEPAFAELEVSRDQPDWDDFRRKLPSDRSLPELWVLYFEILCEELTEAARSRDRARSNRFGIPVIDPLRYSHARIIPPPVTVGTPWQNASASRVRRVEGARNTVSDAEAKLAVAVERRGRASQPHGAVSGLLCLLAIFLLTVVPSLLLLAPMPVALSRAQSAAILGLFFLGFAVMFAYFLRVALGLRDGHLRQGRSEI